MRAPKNYLGLKESNNGQESQISDLPKKRHGTRCKNQF